MEAELLRHSGHPRASWKLSSSRSIQHGHYRFLRMYLHSFEKVEVPEMCKYVRVAVTTDDSWKVMPTEHVLSIVVLITFDDCLHRKGSFDLCSTFTQRRQVVLYRLPNGRFSNFHRTKMFICAIFWKMCTTRMWANAQRDGRPAEYRWHPLFTLQFGWRPLLPCSNAAKTRNSLKLPGVPGCPKLTKRSQPLVGRSSPYCGQM